MMTPHKLLNKESEVMNELIGKAQEYVLRGNQDAFDAFVSSTSEQYGIFLPKLHADELNAKKCRDQPTESQHELLQKSMSRMAEIYADELEEIRKDPKFVGSEKQLEILRSILTVGRKTVTEEKR